MRLHGGLSRSRPTLGDERGSDSPERAIAFRETDRADRRRADDTYGDERGASLLTGGRVLGNGCDRSRGRRQLRGAIPAALRRRGGPIGDPVSSDWRETRDRPDDGSTAQRAPLERRTRTGNYDWKLPLILESSLSGNSSAASRSRSSMKLRPLVPVNHSAAAKS